MFLKLNRRCKNKKTNTNKWCKGEIKMSIEKEIETKDIESMRIVYDGKGNYIIPKEEVLKFSPTMDIFLDSLGNAIGESAYAARLAREKLKPILPEGYQFSIDGDEEKWVIQMVKPIFEKVEEGVK